MAICGANEWGLDVDSSLVWKQPQDPKRFELGVHRTAYSEYSGATSMVFTAAGTTGLETNFPSGHRRCHHPRLVFGMAGASQCSNFF